MLTSILATAKRGPRNKKSKSPTGKSAAPTKDGEFTFITAGKPADFRSKKTMTEVRKKAMDSYLKNEKSKDHASTSSTEESNSVVPEGTFSQSITQLASIATDSVRLPQSTTGRQRPGVIQQMPHVHRDSSSSPSNQVAKLHSSFASVLRPADLITPSRKGIELPFDVKRIPEIRSLGIPLDPFGTMFQSSNALVSVEKLKWHCSRYFGTYGLGKHWIPYCLDHPHTFLSTLCLAAAHKDVLEGNSSESLETAALRQDVIVMVGENLLNPTKSVADHNIIAVSQLIICEVISRKEADLAFHEKGMETMIEMRGGLSKLGVNGRLASAVSWVHLASAILRGVSPGPMYLEFCNRNQAPNYPPMATVPDSPIFCPRERLFTLERSAKCSPKALELLNDMRAMIDLFLSDSHTTQSKSNGLTRLHARITSEHPSIAHSVRTRVLREEDWKYEAIRITAVVLATAMTLRLSLPHSLATVAPTRNMSTVSTTSIASRSNESLFSTLEYQQMTPVTDYSTSPSFSMVSTSPGIDPSCFPFDAHSLAASSPHTSPHAQRPSISSAYSSSDMAYFRPTQPSRTTPSGPTALLTDLKDALEKSNLSDCWADMAGVLLWIGLVMGAASRNSENKVLSRYFSATTMRAAIMLCFDHPEPIHTTMLTMTKIGTTLQITAEITATATATTTNTSTNATIIPSSSTTTTTTTPPQHKRRKN